MPCCRDPGRLPSLRPRCDACRLRDGSRRGQTSASRQRAVPTEYACRRGHQSAACEWLRRCPDDRPEGAPGGRSAAVLSRSATPLRRRDPIRTARITSPGASPTRADASRFTAICSCGKPVSCSARRSVSPSTPLMSASACPANRESSSRSGPKIRTEMSAGVRRGLRRSACRAAS